MRRSAWWATVALTALALASIAWLHYQVAFHALLVRATGKPLHSTVQPIIDACTTSRPIACLALFFVERRWLVGMALIPFALLGLALVHGLRLRRLRVSVGRAEWQLVAATRPPAAWSEWLATLVYAAGVAVLQYTHVSRHREPLEKIYFKSTLVSVGNLEAEIAWIVVALTTSLMALALIMVGSIRLELRSLRGAAHSHLNPATQRTAYTVVASRARMLRWSAMVWLLVGMLPFGLATLYLLAGYQAPPDSEWTKLFAHGEKHLQEATRLVTGASVVLAACSVALAVIVWRFIRLAPATLQSFVNPRGLARTAWSRQRCFDSTPPMPPSMAIGSPTSGNSTTCLSESVSFGCPFILVSRSPAHCCCGGRRTLTRTSCVERSAPRATHATQKPVSSWPSIASSSDRSSAPLARGV